MGKVKVSNGKETLEIDGNDLQSAVKDGYKPTERIVVANSKTQESFEIDPADVQSAMDEGFSFQDIVKKKQNGGVSPTVSNSLSPSAPTEPEPPKDLLQLAKERKKIKNLQVDKQGDEFYGSGNEGDNDLAKKRQAELATVNDQLKTAGGDEALADDLEDIPEGQGFSMKENVPNLIKLRQSNPNQYQRELGAVKSKGELFNAIRDKTDLKTAGEMVRGLQAAEQQDYRSGTKQAIALTRQVVDDGDEQNKIIENIKKDKYYDYGLRGMESQDERFQGLNPYQVTYMHFLEDTSPAEFEALSEKLKTNPDDMWMGSNETDIRKGYEQKAKEAEVKGMTMMRKAYEEKLTNYKNKVDGGEQLTPEEQQDAQKLSEDYKTLQKDIQGQAERYPLTALTDANKTIQDLYGSQAGQGKSFLQGITSNLIDKPLDFAEKLVGENDTVDDLEKLGDQDYTDMVQWKTPEGESEQRQYNTTVSPELKKKLDEIWGDENLSEGEKRSQMALLVAKNQSHIGYEKNPKAGEINLTGKSILNRINSTAAQLLPQLALTYMTGGGANASQVQELSSLFGSTLAMSNHDFYIEALKKNIKNPGEYAFAHAVIEAASELPFNNLKQLREVFGTSKIGKVLGKVSQEEFDAIAKAGGGKFKKVAEAFLKAGGGKFKKVAEAFLKAGAASNKAAIEEGAEAVMGDIGHNIANKDMFQQNEGDVMAGSLKSFVNTYIGMLPMGLLGGVSQHRNSTLQEKYALFEAASNPQDYLSQLEKQEKSGQIDPEKAAKIKANIQKAASVIASIPTENLKGQKLTDNQKAEYLYNQVAKNDIKEQQKNVPASVHENMKEEAEKLDEENAKILSTENKAKPRVRVVVGKPAEAQEAKSEEPVTPKVKPVQKIEDFETELNSLLNPEAPQQTTGQTSEPTENQAGEEGLDKLTGEANTPASENSAEDYLKKGTAVLNQLFPGIKVSAYDTAAEYEQKEGRPQGSAGVFDPQTNRIAFNMELIKQKGAENTIFHEIIHPIVNQAIGNNDDKLNSLFDGLSKLKDEPGMSGVWDHMYYYASRGGKIQKVEAVTEFLSLAADGKIDTSKLSEKTLTKIIDILNKIFEAIGINKKISTATDLKRLSDSIKGAFATEDTAELSATLGNKTESSSTEKLDALKGDDRMNAIKDLIERSRNVPAEQLKESLKTKAGLSDEEIELLMQPKRGIRHEDTAKIRSQQGIPEYEKESEAPGALEKWRKEAEEKLNNGYDVQDLLKRMEDGEQPNKIEQQILDIHVNNLNSQLLNNPSAATLNELRRAVDLSDKLAGSEVAKSLVSRRNMTGLKEGSLGDFLIQKEKAIGIGQLSQEEIDDQVKKYNELKEAHENLQKAVEKLKDDQAKLLIEGEKKSAPKSEKKDHKQIRKNAIASAREALKKLRTGQSGLSAVPLFGTRELIAIAPHVKTYVKDLIEEGVEKLADVIDRVHDEFKDVLDGITKSDVRDIIAGEYNEERKPTINEARETLRNLQTEASLLKQIEDARLGIEKEKSPSAKRQKSRRILELEEKLKEVQRYNKIKQQADEGVTEQAEMEEPKTEAERLAALRKRLQTKINSLEKDLSTGRFKDKAEAPPVKLDPATRKLKDRVIELERQRQNELAKDEYEKMSKWQRGWDKFLQFAGIRRIVQTAVDISIVLRQGVTIALNFRKWKIGKNSLMAAFKSIFTPKRFRRLMYDIRHSEYYHDMVADGVRFNDLEAADPLKRNEEFQKSFIYKIPILREPLLASNRAADAFLNTARYELYMRGLRMLDKQGVTRQNDVKEYEALSKWAMNTTGSGSMVKWLEDSKGVQRFLGNTFFGARLMASRFNLLNPYYYAKMPPKIRKEAMKDMAFFTGTIMITGLALAAAGAKISFDPDDPEFLQVRFGNKVFDITGGMAIYIRTYLRIGEAAWARGFESKNEASDKVDNAKKSVLSFFTNKLAPNTSYAWSALTGKKGGGQDFDPYDIIKAYPMYVDDLVSAWKDDGILGSMVVLGASVFGAGIQVYPPQGGGQDLQTLLDRNVRSDEQDFEKIKAYDADEKEREITDKEMGEYIKLRDEKIKAGIEKLYTQGADIIVNEEPTTVPFPKLSKEQVVEETTRIKSAATRETKEELFPVPDDVKKQKQYQQKELKKYKEDKQ